VVAQLPEARLHRGRGVDRVVHDRDAPATDHVPRAAGKAVSGRAARLPRAAVGGQEGGPQEISHGQRQERTAGHGSADRVDAVFRQEVTQPLDVRPQHRGPQEQGIEIQPQVPVIPRAQLKMAAPGMSQAYQLRFHPAMVMRRARFRKGAAAGCSIMIA
jgi:hypothetical protein